MKFKWDIMSWHSLFLVGIGFIYIYICVGVPNYDEIIEYAKTRELITRDQTYYALMSILHSFFGKPTTIIILGILSFTPFSISIYKLTKRVRGMKKK